MDKIVSQVVLDYLDELQHALNLPNEAAQAIVEEVRADLMEHVQRHMNAGRSEDKAVELALAEMGPPAELATEMARVVPPLGGPLARGLRYVATVGLAVVCASVFWHVRAMSVGVSWMRILAMAAVLLPALLLLWPTIIWRRNWMFTSIPAVVIMLAAFFLVTTGTSQSTELVVDATADAAAVERLSDDSWLAATRWIALGLMTGLTLYLLIMMQRRVQRLAALLLMLLAVAAVEGPFALEEYYYAEQLERAQAMLANHKSQHGKLPSKEEFGALSSSFRYHLFDDGQQYSLFWDRTFSPGYALCYSSRNGDRWVND